MYYCKECNSLFLNAAIYTECHGLESGPFEKFLVCPRCKSTSFGEDERSKRYANR